MSSEMLKNRRINTALQISCTMLLLIITAALFLPANIALAQDVKPNRSFNDSLAAKIDAEVKTYVEKGFSGAVLVAKRNKIILNKTYGNAAGLGANPNFWIASMSKSFTAAAILKLQEQGKLSVTDPLTKFFVDVPADKQQITVHNLLNHTSGLPDKYASDGITEREKAAEAILALALDWKVGEAYHYSNDGYSLLAIIVEVASKMSFEDYLRKEILRPAKLYHTGFWGFEEKANLAPFADGTNPQRADATIYKAGKSVANWGWRGAAGLYSTTEDVYKWMLALEKNKVLNLTSREQLWGKQVLIASVSPIEDAFYGYGWGLRFRNGKRFNIRHLGDDTFTGHNGGMALYANGDAFAVLSNAGASDGTSWSLLLARSLYKRLEQ